jgi:hypothetical protein
LFFCFYSHAFFQCKVKARNTQDSVRYQSELYQNHVHARGPSVHGGAAPAEHDEHGARGHWRGAPRAQPWAAGPPGAPEAPGGRSPGRRGVVWASVLAMVFALRLPVQRQWQGRALRGSGAHAPESKSRAAPAPRRSRCSGSAPACLVPRTATRTSGSGRAAGSPGASPSARPGFKPPPLSRV